MNINQHSQKSIFVSPSTSLRIIWLSRSINLKFFNTQHPANHSFDNRPLCSLAAIFLAARPRISQSSSIPTYPALISRAEPSQTANNSRQSRVSYCHPRGLLAGRAQRGERRIGQSQSYITRHYLFLRFSSWVGRPSELPNAARTAALTSASAQKRPATASSPLREFNPPV